MVFRKLAQTMVVLLAASLGTGAPAAENAGIGHEDVSSGQVSPPSYSTGRESRKVAPPSGGAAQSAAASAEMAATVVNLTPGPQGPPGSDGAAGPAGPAGKNAPIVERRVVDRKVVYVVRDGRGMSRAQVAAYIASLRATDRPGHFAGAGHGALQHEIASWDVASRSFVEARDTQERQAREAADMAEVRDRQAGDNALWVALRGRPTWMGVAALIAAALALCGLVYLIWRWLNCRRGGVQRRIARRSPSLRTTPRIFAPAMAGSRRII